MSVWNCVVVVTCVRQCAMYLHEGVSCVTCQAVCDVPTWRCLFCFRQCVMSLHEGVLFLCVSGNVWCTYMWVCYCYLCQAMCDVPNCGCVTVTCVRQSVMYLHAGVLLLPVSGSVWWRYVLLLPVSGDLWSELHIPGSGQWQPAGLWRGQLWTSWTGKFWWCARSHHHHQSAG